MATATKPMSFKKQVFEQLKDEVSILTPIIGFNDEGHLTGLALTRKELVNLMNNKDTKGVIATDTTFGAVGFHLKSKLSSTDAELVPNQRVATELIDFTFDESFAFIITLEEVASYLHETFNLSHQDFINMLKQAYGI
ncbi:hypothetical protein ACQUY5_18760 [Bacillus cereus]|uniref:hypothetical protein n=1 Tax=Bacillus cereus TaxID=1396 RepID=UPI003D1750AB